MGGLHAARFPARSREIWWWRLNTAAFGLVVAATPIVGRATDHGLDSWTLLVVAALWVLPLAALPTVRTRVDALSA